MEPSQIRFESQLNNLRPILLTLAEAMISPAYRTELEPSDLVQQTLMEAHHSRQLLESLTEGPLFAWLRAALKNNLLDAVKYLTSQKNNIGRKVRISEIEDSFLRLERVLAADETTPSQVVQRNEQIALMLAALQTLPGNQRQAVIMKHLQGHSLKHVAEALGKSEAATAGLLHRGRQQLLRCLEDHKDE